MAGAEAPAARGRRLAIALGLILAVLCALPGLAASSADAAALTGWLGNGAGFPQRALVLVPPPGARVSSATVHVTENGRPVHGLAVTPTTAAGPGDFGLMVLVGGSRQASPAVRSAVSGLIGLRTAQQEFGLIALGRHPSLLSPLSTDSSVLSSAAAGFGGTTPTGSDAPGAIQLALTTLAKARVALGAVVVISDGVGKLTDGAAIPTAVSGAAAAARVPIFTVGLQDPAASASSLAALRRAAPGQFVQVTPARLAAMLKEIDGVLTRGDIVRWRSIQPAGRAVNVAAHVAGVPGSVTAAYSSPASHRATVKPHRAAPRPGPAAAANTQLSPSGHLSPVPAFALGPVAAVRPAAASAASSSGSPLSTGLGEIVLVGLVGALVAAAVLLAFYRPSRRGVRARVGSFVDMQPASDEEDPFLLDEEPSKSIVHRLRTSDRWKSFELDVEIARSPHTPIYLVKRAALIAIVTTGLVTVVTGSKVLAMLPIVGCWFVLRKLIRRTADKQRETFRQSLPGYLQDLGSAIRVGRSLVGALTVVAESADEPTKSELERAITDEALGRPLEASIDAVAERMEAPDLGQVALIAALNRRSGSNVAEALDRVSEGARERQDLKREVAALTAQAKMSSAVLTGLPGVLLLGLTVVSPRYAYPLLHTTLGIAALCLGGAMCFGGWKVMKKITDVKV
jgi:tight adherence protein B